MIFKDLLWWLLKENYFINFIYREFFVFIFPVKVNKYGIEKTPLMHKDSVIEITSKKKPFTAIKGYTSGTTNKPLTVYRSAKSILLEEYIVKSYLKTIGISLRPNIAVLRGDNLKISNGIYWKKMPFSKRLILSSYQISETTANNYLRALEEYKPHIIMAYPSAITLLAKYAQKLNWELKWDLSGVLTSSETFSLENQQIVRSVFGHVFDHYGQAERVAILQQCKKGNYHVREDYSYVEFVSDKHGMRIVGTNIHNKAMPLKRYDTEDYVEGVNQSGDCKCGNSSPYVQRILGRDDDYVILKNGRQIGRLDVVFKGLEDLLECQLEQTLLSELVVRYVPDVNADIEILESSIKNRLEERLGNDIAILFQQVSEIPRTTAGKFRAVIRNRDILGV